MKYKHAFYVPKIRFVPKSIKIINIPQTEEEQPVRDDGFIVIMEPRTLNYDSEENSGHQSVALRKLRQKLESENLEKQEPKETKSEQAPTSKSSIDNKGKQTKTPSVTTMQKEEQLKCDKVPEKKSLKSFTSVSGHQPKYQNTVMKRTEEKLTVGALIKEKALQQKEEKTLKSLGFQMKRNEVKKDMKSSVSQSNSVSKNEKPKKKLPMAKHEKTVGALIKKTAFQQKEEKTPKSSGFQPKCNEVKKDMKSSVSQSNIVSKNEKPKKELPMAMRGKTQSKFLQTNKVVKRN